MKLCLHVRICPGGARQLASLPELDLADGAREFKRRAAPRPVPLSCKLWGLYRLLSSESQVTWVE